MSSLIRDNLASIREDIAKEALLAGRNPEDIRLIAVSKTFPSEALREAHVYGQRDFAENRVGEGEQKRGETPDLDFTFHLIGHLQSNKINKAIRVFDVIHSVDSLSLVQKINQACERERKVMPILVQVNTSQEAQKSGLIGGESAVFRLVEEILILPYVKLQGLMTIGPLSMDEKETRHAFANLRKLLTRVNEKFSLCLSDLSMGMTHDFLWAIQEGATMVRVGNGIFGKRPYQIG